MSFFSEHRVVKELLKHKKQVVFYAENRHYFQYFERLIRDLLERKVVIHYITSDKNDPLLTAHIEGLNVACVKWQLGFLFSHIRAQVFIMTMPDLGNFLFKRSPGVDEYIYMFHAAVSTHQQYNLEAFFNYDTIFCVGAFQKKEIKRTEDLYKLKEKKIIEYGYPLLEAIMENAPGSNFAQAFKQKVLIAPSWFEGCIFDTCIEELVQRLSNTSYQVILRSHPEYEKRRKKEFARLKNMISGQPDVFFDATPGIVESLMSADYLITDRSGIAFEFAFGRLKPVVFIDTVLKQFNKEWERLNIEPVENVIRQQLGISLLPTQLDQLEAGIKVLEARQNSFKVKILELKQSLFYNSTYTYRQGADYILNKIRGA